MITRISVALFALYLVHGSDNAARDGARLAEEVRRDAPKAALSLCLDNAAVCGVVAAKAGDLLTPSGARKPSASVPEPIETDHYPLPPRRPEGFAKKA